MKKILITLGLILSLNTFAKEAIDIQNAKIRLTPPNAKVTAVFLKVVNNSDKDIKLIDAKGDFAEKFELHNMEMGGGKMVMRAVKEIEVKKNSSVELTSGGLHVMVFDLKKPLIEGSRYKLKLILNDKSEVATEVVAEKM